MGNNTALSFGDGGGIVGCTMATIHSLSRLSRRRACVTFSRQELSLILDVYSRRVMRGDWKDYAIEFGDGMAVFSIFNGQYGRPLFSIAKMEGASRSGYAVFAGPQKIRQGGDLARVLSVFDRRLELVFSAG